MIIKLSRASAIPMLISALGLVGCSTTQPIVSQWSNPGYTSPSFKRIVVGAVGTQTSIRRNFEDEFVVQLRAAGVDSVPSYRYIPEHQTIDEAKLKQAAREAGADAAILARLVSVEQKTEYGQAYYPVPALGIFGRNVGATWSGGYGSPRVYRYDVYTSEATLYDAPKNDVVWTGTIKTVQPENVPTAIKSYVETVIKALNEKKLLAVKE